VTTISKDSQRDVEVPVGGAELALLLRTSRLLSTGYMRTPAARESIAAVDRRLATEAANRLFLESKKLYEAHDLYDWPDGVSPRDYARKREAIRGIVMLTQEQIRTCMVALRICHEEHATSWASFTRGLLEGYDLAPEDLDKLNAKLAILAGNAEQVKQPWAGVTSMANEATAREKCLSVTVSLDGAELALLVGATSLATHWPFERASAKAMVRASESERIGEINDQVSAERIRIIVAAGLHPSQHREWTSEHQAMSIHVGGDIEFGPAQLHLCVWALRLCHEEFVTKWNDFCAAGPTGLVRPALGPADLLRLADRLELVGRGRPPD
jgi:hypothetical protein